MCLRGATVSPLAVSGEKTATAPSSERESEHGTRCHTHALSSENRSRSKGEQDAEGASRKGVEWLRLEGLARGERGV